MKYGRLLAIAGILVGCLLGCAVRRSGSSSDSRRTEERRELSWLTSRTATNVTATTTVTDRWRNLRIHWRDYDLSKPADSAGNYPVRSEGWADANEQETKDEKSDVSENTEEEASGKAETDLDASQKKTTDMDMDAQAGVEPLWWWLIGVLMAVVGIIFLWWKYGKKDKTK